MRVLATPIAALPDQLAYVRAVTLALHGALKRLPELYLTDPDVRAILALPPREEAWLRRYWTPAVSEQNTVVGRHDAAIDFGSPGWKDSLQFLEPNLGGIGGLHMIPTASRILAEVVLPALRARDPHLELESAQDIRALLMQDLLDHLEATGGRAGRCASSSPSTPATALTSSASWRATSTLTSGSASATPTPRSSSSRRRGDLRRPGSTSSTATTPWPTCSTSRPRAWTCGPCSRPRDQPRPVLDRRRAGPEELLAGAGRSALARRHFGSEDRAFFRRHLPWTRLLRAGTTTSPTAPGGTSRVRRHAREDLVLKPNRGYGGTGVAVGLATDAAEWKALVAAALAPGDERWVAQRLVPLPVYQFPVLEPTGGSTPSPSTSVRLRAQRVRARHPRARVTGPGRQRRAAGWHVRLVVGHPPGRIVL